MSKNEIAAKIRELRELQTLIAEAEEASEAIKDEIKAFMGEEEELHAGEYKVTWKSVTSTKLDTAALKKALPEVAARFSKETTARRFCVT